MRSIKELAEEFPKQFKNGTTPCFSEYPVGWHDLIRNVCKQVDVARIPITWAQIKEKFGHLRMYEDVHDAHKELVGVYNWISEAERLSAITCQDCGRKASEKVFRGLIITLCYTCLQRRKLH